MQRPSDDFARVRHACGAGVARTGGTEGAAQRYIPVEVKVCADGEFAYMVVLDARVPTRLEGLLPDFLLSTSACSAICSTCIAMLTARAAQATTCARRAAASSRRRRCC